MFNLSIPDLMVIGAAGLLVFGPKRLPELARSLGESARELKRALEKEEPTAFPIPQIAGEEPASREVSPAAVAGPNLSVAGQEASRLKTT